MNNELKSNEQKGHGKYYVVETKSLANTLEWITGQKPYKFFDKNKTNGNVIYSFIRDETFSEALDILHNARKKLRKEY